MEKKLTKEQIAKKYHATEELGRKYHRYQRVDLQVSMADCKRPPKLVFDYAGEDSYFTHEHNTIVIGIPGLVFFPDGAPMWDTEEEFNALLTYMIGHEKGHRRSTTKRGWLYGLEGGYKKVVEEIAKKMEGKPVPFRKPEDYDFYLKDTLPKNHKVQVSAHAIKRLCHFVCNSIEDGRTERLQSKRSLGFSQVCLISRGKNWQHSPCEKPGAGMNRNKEILMVVLNQVLSLATTGVYQKGFYDLYGDTEAYTYASSFVPDIRESVLAGTCKKAMSKAIDIAVKLIDLIIEECNDEPDLSQMIEDALKEMEEKMNNSSQGLENEDQRPKSGMFGGQEVPAPSLYGTDDKEEQTGNENGGSFNIFAKADEEDAEDGEDGKGESGKSGSGDGQDGQGAGSVQQGDGEEADGQTGNQPQGADGSESAEKAEGQGTCLKGNPDTICEGGMQGSKGQHIDKDAEPDEEYILDAMKKAADEVRELLDVGVEATACSGKREAAEIYDNSVMPDVSEICTSFQGYTREYTVTEQLPVEYHMRGMVMHRKYKRYFESLKKPILRERRSGRLDAAGLYKAAMRQIDLFKKDAVTKGFDGCVEIFIDNSGSMCGIKKQEACLATGIIEEAFKGLLPVKIVAFDSTGTVNHEIIKNWNESLRGNCCYNYFVKSRNGGGTPTTETLLIGEKELLERPEEHKLMILMTDENAAYAGEYLTETIKKVRNSGIKLVGIYFDEKISESDIRGFDALFDGKDNICALPEDIDENLCRIVEKFARS